MLPGLARRAGAGARTRVHGGYTWWVYGCIYGYIMGAVSGCLFVISGVSLSLALGLGRSREFSKFSQSEPAWPF